jgi:hypothetical protein
VRFQDRLNFHAPLDPEKAKGKFSMSDFPSDAGDGALFKNREKSKPSQPDYFGKAEIEGRKYRISAWIKESKKDPGQKYMSLSFRLADDRAGDRPQQPERGGPDFDSQIPF